MKQTNRRLQALEDKAAERKALRNEAEGALERINARLNVIASRLRAGGIVFDVDPNELAERMAMVKADLRRT